ncbi:MAG TPA: hypothetical protein VE155_02040 [Pseudonocardiaceae bacterium]|nr:hypothetical protein [Pseudonocardiaceae bacterium]
MKDDHWGQSLDHGEVADFQRPIGERSAMRIRSGYVIVSTALLLAGLVGCGGKEIDKPVTTVSDLVAVCSGRHSTTAAAYAGAPPHPILVVRPNGAVQDMLENPKLAVLGPPWNPQDAAAVQLVACTESDGGGADSGLLCPYPSGQSASLRFANYTITVYEARTGTKVGQAHVEARDTCPLSASVYRQDPVVYATPSPQQYFDALETFVNQR